MRFRPCLAVLMASTLAGVGCKKAEIQVYQAPKDMAVTAPAASASAPAADSRPERTPWQVPEGWTEKPRESGSMRIASYGITSPDGRSADVSVIPLGPVAGGELDNVNRWRGQIGLAPITQPQLDSQTGSAAIGSVTGKLYDMVGTEPALDGKYKARTLAAVLSLGGTTVFFKMTGEDALVSENRPKFLAWLKSVDTGDSAGSSTSSTSSSPASATPPSTAPAATAPPAAMAGPVTPPPATGLPQWEVPDGWKPVQASTMRLASFAVGSGGDLSVVALGPAAGGTLANITRWRGQMGLAPIGAGDIAGNTTNIPLEGGAQAVVAELEGAGTAAGRKMLAAIVARPDRTWFYKLTGDAALVAGEHDRFVKFVKSVKY